jgi:plasmid maintenance system antidote protein VapI
MCGAVPDSNREVDDAQSWLNLQQHYELECAQRSLGPVLAKIHPRAA